LFEEVFIKLQDKNNEIKLMGVWGKDGLELEKKYFTDVTGVDLELAGAELADVISKLEGMRISPDRYLLKLHIHGFYLFVFSLTPDFFLMILCDPAVIQSKLKFYLDLYKEQLVSAL
jgi:hypothetical protein